MPLLPSATILASLVPGMLYTSYLLIASPTTLFPNQTIRLLGASMGVRPAIFPVLLASASQSKSTIGLQMSSLDEGQRELLAMLGLLIAAFAGIIGLLSRGLTYSKAGLSTRDTEEGKTVRKDSGQMVEECYALLTNQTLWQTVSGAMVFASGTIVASVYLSGGGGRVSRTSGYGLLANDVVFTVCMASMLFWGYLYTVLRDERREVLSVLAERRERDEQDRVDRGE